MENLQTYPSLFAAFLQAAPDFLQRCNDVFVASSVSGVVPFAPYGGTYPASSPRLLPADM